MTEQFTVYYSKDEFVNEAVAEIAVRLQNDTSVEVQSSDTEIIIECDNPIEKIEEIVCGELFQNTHRRSSIARYYQSKSIDTDITSPREPFPDEHDIVGDSVDESDLEQIGITDVDSNIESNLGQRVYTLSPSYTGDPIDWQTKRLRRYIDAMKSELDTEYKADTSCRCCSRDDLPTWRYDGELVDYNQQFTPLVTTNGQTPLGQRGAQSSKHRGRCVACLVAGFAYKFIEKPFFTVDRDYRIFSLKGTFDSLIEVRKDYKNTVLTDIDAMVDDETPRYKVLSSNIPSNVRSDEGQLLSLLSRLLEAYVEEKGGKYSGSEFVQRITGLVAFTSSNSKGGNPVRGISSMKRYELFDDVYDILQPVTYEKSVGDKTTEVEYRVGAFVESVSEVQPAAGPGDKVNRLVSEFSKGVLNQDTSRVEDGLFGLSKLVVTESAFLPSSSIDILGAKHYLVLLLGRMTGLNESEIESLSSVGSSLGGMFDTRSDVSVLMSLKNANNVEQLVAALEKAGVEGMKKSLVRGEHIEGYNLVRNDELEQCMKSLSDAEKFEQAKNVLVSHASLSALYSNSQSDSA